MKRHKPYTTEEVSKPSPKDYFWDKGTMRFGKWWQRGRNTKEGIGCFCTDPRNEHNMFAFIRRHECGEITVMTTRESCMTVDAMAFAYNVMAVFDECMDKADGLRTAKQKGRNQ